MDMDTISSNNPNKREIVAAAAAKAAKNGKMVDKSIAYNTMQAAAKAAKAADAAAIQANAYAVYTAAQAADAAAVVEQSITDKILDTVTGIYLKIASEQLAIIAAHAAYTLAIADEAAAAAAAAYKAAAAAYEATKAAITVVDAAAVDALYKMKHTLPNYNAIDDDE